MVDDDIALEGDQSFNICVGDSTSMVVIIDDDGEYIMCSYEARCYFSPTVPQLESGDVIINEDGGTAVVNVRLVNEIEKDLVLDYSTGEVPGGAEGMCHQRQVEPL